MSSPAETPLQAADRLRRAGESRAAMELLRDAIRRGRVAGEALARAGNFLARELAADARSTPSLHVRLVGQCTTTWIGQAMVAVAWGQGVALRVTEAAYDTVVQDVSGLHDTPDVLIFVPWSQRLLERTTAPCRRASPTSFRSGARRGASRPTTASIESSR